MLASVVSDDFNVARYCQIFSDLVKYCLMLCNIVRYCLILFNIVQVAISALSFLSCNNILKNVMILSNIVKNFKHCIVLFGIDQYCPVAPLVEILSVIYVRVCNKFLGEVSWHPTI